MFVLGIDLGTSSCKVVLVDASGKIIKFASSNYALMTPAPLCYEQEPQHWWDAMVISVQQVMSGYSGNDIKGIGLSGQMSGLVLLDKNDAVLRPAILWNDGRAHKECDFLDQLIPNIIHETGNYPVPGLVAPKIIWLQRNEPQIWGKVKTLLLPKDYLRFRLTGEKITDMSDGSLTLLMNVKKRKWSNVMLNACGIDESYLCSLVEGNAVGGKLMPSVAAVLNLEPGTPVVGGAGDQPAAAVGLGCVSPGQTLISLGTSGVVLSITDSYKENHEKGINSGCHALPNTWYHMGVMLSAAGSLQWYRDTCAANIDFDSLCKSTQEIPIGSEGLTFLPYLTGERTPYCDPYLRGAFIGLARKHTQAHLSRAVLEGIGIGLSQSITLIRKAGIEIKEAVINGAGIKSDVWMQILADIFNITLIRTDNSEAGPAFGAACLALMRCCNTQIKYADIMATSTKTLPQQANVEQYRVVIEQFKNIYPFLSNYSHNVV